MHYHCEIIMPKTKDIENDVEKLMSPFSENNKDEEEALQPFWDWYQIGGRWSGAKEMCSYDSNKLDDFYKALNDNKITVSGLQCGKQEVSPASQIPIVDKLWNEFFPTENGEMTECPVFKHSNNEDSVLSCDICLVEDIPDDLKCCTVIIGGPGYNNELLPQFVMRDSVWNGVNHMDIDWDKNVKTAINMFKEKTKSYRKEYIEKVTPKNDWICVTIDYHS